MSATPSNTIVILSDEHNRDILGCYGDPIVRTPNLDRLASEGVLFRNAYTNSPVCVPARASFATGLYPHQMRAWDSVTPHDGTIKGWGARLIDAGHEVVSIGKLHFRSSEDPNGFSKEIIPMHVVNGVGWLSSLLRDPPVRLSATDDMAGSIGAGETKYTKYDRDVTARASDWLRNAAAKPTERPWVLYLGLVAPHFPLVAPEPFYHLYDDADIPPPRQYAEDERPRHPVIEAMRYSSNYDDYFTPEKVKIARQGYYGLCSFLDDNIGKVLAALDETGLGETTRVIYSTDHGDNMGNRGLWGKSVMYEDSVAVPMIVRGPGLPAGETVDTPVSLVDLHPTILDFAGNPLPDNSGTPGKSLATIIDTPDPDRAVFSEYHDWSSVTGMFMLRRGDWKLVRYAGYAPQLFNLKDDPEERVDLADDPACATVMAELDTALNEIADPDELNRQAFADQAKKIERYGGREAILNMPEQGFTPTP
ncbi:MAG: sulfatase-like hydrolase/transferase [Alphaproteobacteria bacterium]